MKLLEILGLVPISTSAERVAKLKAVYEGRLTTKEEKIKRLQQKIETNNVQRNTLREKLYKANNWQIHVEVNKRDLSGTTLSAIITTELKKKLTKPFTLCSIKETNELGQEGKIEVYINSDKEDTCYLYYSYIIIN